MDTRFEAARLEQDAQDGSLERALAKAAIAEASAVAIKAAMPTDQPPKPTDADTAEMLRNLERFRQIAASKLVEGAKDGSLERALVDAAAKDVPAAEASRLVQSTKNETRRRAADKHRNGLGKPEVAARTDAHATNISFNFESSPANGIAQSVSVGDSLYPQATLQTTEQPMDLRQIAAWRLTQAASDGRLQRALVDIAIGHQNGTRNVELARTTADTTWTDAATPRTILNSDLETSPAMAADHAGAECVRDSAMHRNSCAGQEEVETESSLDEAKLLEHEGTGTKTGAQTMPAKSTKQEGARDHHENIEAPAPVENDRARADEHGAEEPGTNAPTTQQDSNATLGGTEDLRARAAIVENCSAGAAGLPEHDEVSVIQAGTVQMMPVQETKEPPLPAPAPREYEPGALAQQDSEAIPHGTVLLNSGATAANVDNSLAGAAELPEHEETAVVQAGTMIDQRPMPAQKANEEYVRRGHKGIEDSKQEPLPPESSPREDECTKIDGTSVDEPGTFASAPQQDPEATHRVEPPGARAAAANVDNSNVQAGTVTHVEKMPSQKIWQETVLWDHGGIETGGQQPFPPAPPPRDDEHGRCNEGSACNPGTLASAPKFESPEEGSGTSASQMLASPGDICLEACSLDARDLGDDPPACVAVLPPTAAVASGLQCQTRGVPALELSLDFLDEVCDHITDPTVNSPAWIREASERARLCKQHSPRNSDTSSPRSQAASATTEARDQAKSKRYEDQENRLQNLRRNMSRERLTSVPAATTGIEAVVAPAAPQSEVNNTNGQDARVQHFRTAGLPLGGSKAGHMEAPPSAHAVRSEAPTTVNPGATRTTLEELVNMQTAEMSTRNWGTVGDQLMRRKWESWSTSPCAVTASASSTASANCSQMIGGSGPAASSKAPLDASWIRGMWSTGRRHSAITPMSSSDGVREVNVDKSFSDIFSQAAFDELLLQVRAGSTTGGRPGGGACGAALATSAAMAAPSQQSPKALFSKTVMMSGAAQQFCRAVLPAPPDFEPPVCRTLAQS
jgi:hypothetical protein